MYYGCRPAWKTLWAGYGHARDPEACRGRDRHGRRRVGTGYHDDSPMGHASPTVDVPEGDPRLGLTGRVEGLWEPGIITGDLLERARGGDLVIVIDFVGERVDVSLLSRAAITEAVRPDCTDAVLLDMARGQPALSRGEDMAAWWFAADWKDGQPVLEIHFAWRAWRDARGTA